MEKTTNDLVMELLMKIVASSPSASAALKEPYTQAEVLEVIRLNVPATFNEALSDFLLARESLEFISSDYQLRLKAEDIWLEQLQVFRDRMIPVSQALKDVCAHHGIDISKEMEALVKYG